MKAIKKRGKENESSYQKGEKSKEREKGKVIVQSSRN